EEIRLVGSSDLTVLITGETGVGKELVAQALHQASSRAHKPLISLNCAALPDTLVESELFGHVRGAFTGAHADRRGKFELAHGGTLF
ncbi:sigma 54-interacting transcriptional regulator, partial [Staphylococcus aureus]|nr:sigma 54-interacting transcriptional regulator [Staphylococcus aureus]